MRSTTIGRFSILIGLPIVLWQFYMYVGFDRNLTKSLAYVVSLLLLLIFFKKIFSNYGGVYNKFISAFIILDLVSFLMAFFYWGQSPVLTFRVNIGPLMMLYYFMLQRMKVSLKELFIVLLVFAAIYAILWLFAASQAPRVVFGNLDELTDTRGYYRILQLRSIDTVCLLFFVSLVQFTRKDSPHRPLFLGICCACLLLIFFTLTRMLIVATILVSAFYILRRRFFLACVLSVVFFLSFDKIANNEIVSSMLNLTESQLASNDDNGLRNPEYNNMFTAYPFHVGTFIFGNGAAHPQSAYGQYEESLKSNLSFNRSDAGYVGIYATYGLSMLILLLLLLRHVYRSKTSINYKGFQLFIFFLFIDNITSYSFWGYGISFSIALYALEIMERKKNLDYWNSRETEIYY